MGAAIPLLMKTPRSCHLSVPPKASPGPVLVPMPCDDLREYRRDPPTPPSPEVGILASNEVWTALRGGEKADRGGVNGARIGRSGRVCRARGDRRRAGRRGRRRGGIRRPGGPWLRRGRGGGRRGRGRGIGRRGRRGRGLRGTRGVVAGRRAARQRAGALRAGRRGAGRVVGT